MIYACLPDTWLWRFTFGLAFHNFKSIIYYYKEVSELMALPDIPEASIFFIDENPELTKKYELAVHKKFPNAKIVMFGSDTIYLGGEAGIPWKVDLYIECVEELVKNIKAFSSKHFYWSVSQTLINKVETETKPPKENLTICLCNSCNNERQHFFENLSNQINLQYNKSLYKINEVISLYLKSKVTLGHTMPVYPGKQRSMKGFRDWLGPICGSALIYDDYPDVIKLGIVPTYPYRDFNRAAQLIKEIIQDEQGRNSLIEKQVAWIKENTIEKQLIRIFNEMGYQYGLDN